MWIPQVSDDKLVIRCIIITFLHFIFPSSTASSWSASLVAHCKHLKHVTVSICLMLCNIIYKRFCFCWGNLNNSGKLTFDQRDISCLSVLCTFIHISTELKLMFVMLWKLWGVVWNIKIKFWRFEHITCMNRGPQRSIILAWLGEVENMRRVILNEFELFVSDYISVVQIFPLDLFAGRISFAWMFIVCRMRLDHL